MNYILEFHYVACKLLCKLGSISLKSQEISFLITEEKVKVCMIMDEASTTSKDVL